MTLYSKIVMCSKLVYLFVNVFLTTVLFHIVLLTIIGIVTIIRCCFLYANMCPEIGIVHGDLKYGNVFINESDDDDLGKVYIIDFERSFIKQDASFQDEWDTLPHTTQTDINRRNKTCLRDMRDLFKEKIV